MWSDAAAARRFRKASDREPDRTEALAGLAEIDIRAFRPGHAVARLRESVRLTPSSPRHSSLARLIHYDPAATRRDIFEEHRAWSKANCPAGGGAPPSRRRGRLRIAC